MGTHRRTYERLWCKAQEAEIVSLAEVHLGGPDAGETPMLRLANTTSCGRVRAGQGADADAMTVLFRWTRWRNGGC